MNYTENSHLLYLPLDQLIAIIEEPARTCCLQLLNQNKDIIEKAPGSSFNHQAWEGGYVDHVTETMNLALHLFHTMDHLRSLPFTLSDALLVLFLHDTEKPWKYNGEPMPDKKTRKKFREDLIQTAGITLTPEQANGLRYVEGENDDYSGKQRVMNELAAFCHMCDVASARIWHDKGRSRSWTE